MTEPVPDPTPPAISELFTPRTRAVIYMLSVMLAPAYVVAEANTAMHWGWVAAYGAWTGLVGALAAANTKRAS